VLSFIVTVTDLGTRPRALLLQRASGQGDLVCHGWNGLVHSSRPW
jgi:hypothetical protein